MLFLIGITITFFLEIILISKKNKNKSDKILAMWLLFLGLNIMLFYLRYSEVIYSTPLLLGLDLPFPLLYGPFLLLYIMTLTNQMPKQKWRIYVYFIPVLFSYILFVPFFLLPAHERIAVYQNRGKGLDTQLTINYIAIIGFSIFCFLRALLLLDRHRKTIKNLFSDTEKINLQWLRYLTYSLGIIYLVAFFFDEKYYFAVIVIFVNFIGFFGIKQVGIFSNSVNTDTTRNILPAEVNDTQKYAKSGLSGDKAEAIYQKLIRLMNEEELYTTCELTLADLSKKLDIHSNYLSQIINEKTSGNFYAYINNLLIEKFLKLVNDPKNSNIKLISLAYDCGFNSKSSFNKYFKNKVGKTPSEYLNDLKKQ